MRYEIEIVRQIATDLQRHAIALSDIVLADEPTRRWGEVLEHLNAIQMMSKVATSWTYSVERQIAPTMEEKERVGSNANSVHGNDATDPIIEIGRPVEQLDQVAEVAGRPVEQLDQVAKPAGRVFRSRRRPA